MAAKKLDRKIIKQKMMDSDRSRTFSQVGEPYDHYKFQHGLFLQKKEITK